MKELLRGLLMPLKRGLERLGLWQLAAPLYRATLGHALATQHGHAILVKTIRAMHGPDDLKGRVMIEIGSTREELHGQGSTAYLADFCKAHGMHFITVDMDPENTQAARETLARRNAGFEAVNGQGELFLAGYAGPVDFLYLDAFDIDHGKHSAARQEKYRAHLGAEINDQACWQMHLDAAQAILGKTGQGSVIAFDDTWRDGRGGWLGKGRDAIPLLLNNGFAVRDVTDMTVSLSA